MSCFKGSVTRQFTPFGSLDNRLKQLKYMNHFSKLFDISADMAMHFFPDEQYRGALQLQHDGRQGRHFCFYIGDQYRGALNEV